MPLFGMSKDDRHRFAFIICVSNEVFYRECCHYIKQLRLPKGFTMEIIPIRDIPCMASGYNAGMAETGAKYKIYMHQNVSILNPNFLNDLLTIFNSDKSIGIVGMIGSPKLPPDAVPWHGDRIGNVYELDSENVDYYGYSYSLKDGLTDVQCVDGFLIATCTDVHWREEVFDGWDYYDTAQCFEFRKKGYRVVVPEQKKPWCAHDEGISNRWGFDNYRKLFMKEYM